MNQNQINQLRLFVKMVIGSIIKEYGGFLSEEKRRLLDENTLIPDNYSGSFSSMESLQGEAIRIVFKNIFHNIECKKEIDFSDGTKKNINYGKYLKDGIVELFSQELAEKHNIKIDKKEDISQNVEIVNKVKNSLGEGFNALAFNCDANVILSTINIPEITKACEANAVKEYIVASNKEKEENSKVKGIVTAPLYINGSQYIKYIDENNTPHMIKSINPKVVSTTYKEMIDKSAQGEEFDIEKFFQTLKKQGEMIPILSDSIAKPSKLSSEESDMLDTIYGDRKEIFKESNNNSSSLSSTIVSNDNTKALLISEEEYEKLCMKAVNNKPLTAEELKQMEYFDLYYFGDGENKPEAKNPEPQVQTEKEVPVKLELEKKNTTGFAHKYLPVFLILTTIAIGIIFGAIVFKLKS